jgi:hypothetical protein
VVSWFSAAEALKLVPTSQGVEVEAALAFALAGDTARAESLAQDLNKRFPLNTQMQSLWLPSIQAHSQSFTARLKSCPDTKPNVASVGKRRIPLRFPCIYPR